MDLHLIKENETKVFEAIQSLKDSVFGLKASYVPFCYTERKQGVSFDWEKYEKFVDGLCACAKEVEGYTDSIGLRLREFFGLVIRFVDLICPADDRCFASFKKLALTLPREEGCPRSVFEVIIQSYMERDELDAAFLKDYESFTAGILHENFEVFYRCEKMAVEKFIDRHALNCLRSSEETMQAVSEIQNLAMRLQREFASARKAEVSEDA